MYSPFSRTAWERNVAIYDTIRTMPFNAELAAGTLSTARFKHYITQDAHYLIGFGRALTLAAAKAPNPDRVVQFAKSAAGAIVVERALHGSFFTVWHHAGNLCANAALARVPPLRLVSPRHRLCGALRGAARRAAAVLLDLCGGRSRHPCPRRAEKSLSGLDRHLCG